MDHEDTSDKVSDPVVLALGKIGNFIFRVFDAIKTGKATLEQLDLNLSMYLSLSFDEREEMIFASRGGTQPLLKPLFEVKKFHLSSLNGVKCICNAKHVFSYIDPFFRRSTKKWDSSAATRVWMYEVTKEGVSFKNIFDSVHGYLEDLVLTQHQVLNFVAQYRRWLQLGGGQTCFLIRNQNDFHVAYIERVTDYELKIYADEMKNCPLWNEAWPPRIVVPRRVP